MQTPHPHTRRFLPFSVVALAAAILVLVVASTSSAAFSAYSLGDLSGQNGWNGGATGGTPVGLTNYVAGSDVVTTAAANSGTQSWLLGGSYVSPGAGTPFTPDVATVGALNATTAFDPNHPGDPNYSNSAITPAGNQSVISFAFKAVAPGDNSRISVYEGSAARTSREGPNVYVLAANATDVDIFAQALSSTNACDNQDFPTVPLATVAAGSWHTVKMTTTYPNVNPTDLSTYGTTTYVIDEGTVGQVTVANQNTDWVHQYDFCNGGPYTPGGSVKWTMNANDYPVHQGFFIDDVSMKVRNTSTNTLVGSFATSFEASAFAQAPLSVNASSPATAGTTQTLTTTGGSGDGAVTYSVGASTACSVAGDQLTIISRSGTCSVTATKAADDLYAAASSGATAVSVAPASVVYVNSSWSGVPAGQDPDGSGPATVMGGNAFSTPQAGINAVANSDGTVNLSGGTFPAGFTVSGKSGLTIVGAGAGSTTIQPSTLISSGITHKYTGNMQVSVLVNNSTNVTISGMTITGNGSAPGAGGPDALVLWNGSTGTLQNDDITGDYTINGDQTGQGIAVDGSSGTVSLAVNDTNVSGFQKNGIDVIDGNGATTGATDTTTLNVSGGSITGAGSTGAIAQNGIVLWDRGGGSVSGSINGTTISGFHYTPLDIPGGDYATGVLTYGTNASATVTQSTLTDSDLSVVNATSAGTLSATNDWWGSASGPGTPSGVTTIPYYLDAGMTALSNNADLTGIALSTGTLNPSFSASTVDYTVSVDYGVSSISITPAANLGATTQVSGGSSLSVGDNVKTIKVTSPDGTVKNYTVTVTRRPDTTSPVIAAHDNIVVVSDTATVVNYTAPDATDNVDATAPANCSPASGSTFDIGATTVTCTKTDAAGNSATPVTFTVTVNQPPATPPTTTTTTTTPTSSTTTTGSETTTITPTSVVVSQAATDQEATTPVVQPTQSGALSAAVSQPTTADGLQPEPVSVIGSWDPGTFGTELGATVLLAPMPLPVAPVGTTPPPPAPIAGGYTLGTTAFVLAVTDSNGAAVHHFSKPLSICVSASEVGDVPASSEDGNTWKPMPLLASPPSDTPPFFPNDTFTDGYVVKADSSVCMYTLHATLFALLKDAQAPTVTKLKVKIEKNDLRLSWVGSDNVKVAGYVVSLNGHGYKATARNHDVVLALKAGTYVVRAHDPSGNVSKPSNTVVVKAVVRKDKHGKSTKHFVITKG